MGKSNGSKWFSATPTGAGGNFGSWRRRSRSPGFYALTAPSQVKPNPISSDNEEQHQSSLLAEAAAMDEEFAWQMECCWSSRATIVVQRRLPRCSRATSAYKSDTA